MQQTLKTKENIVLSIAVLASDRRDTIGKCLGSLAAIRKAVPSELIILDTGCSPETRRVLEEYADKIADFTWCNDFSKARNVTLRMAEGEWFLYLDDDEWFSDVGDLITFFTSGNYREYGSASYVQRNYLDMQGSQYTDTRVGRMAKRTPELRFRSKIHEYLAPISGDHKNLCARVEHYGYVYENEEKKRAHFERNRVLLEQMIKEEPMELRWRLQLLQEYRTMDDYDRMENLGGAGIRMIRESAASEWNETEIALCIGSFYAAQILAADGRQDYAKMSALCEEAARDRHNTRLCRAFLQEMLAKANFYQGLCARRPPDAEEKFRASIQSAEQYLEEYRYFGGHKEELYRQQIAPFVGECFDPVKVKEIYSILICDGLKLKRIDYLQKYVVKLCWNERHVYVFEEIADILISAMNNLAYRMQPEDPAYAAFAGVLRMMYAQGALWEYFCGKIQECEANGQDMNRIMHLIEAALPEAVKEPTDAGSDKETEELQQIAQQVKEQIRLLIANGMKEQAGNVIAQIRHMLPDDAELDELEKQLKTTE